MAKLTAASRKQHPPNGQKASSFAPVSQGAPLAYHMTPEFDAPTMPARVQKTTNRQVHAPAMRGKRGK